MFQGYLRVFFTVLQSLFIAQITIKKIIAHIGPFFNKKINQGDGIMEVMHSINIIRYLKLYLNVHVPKEL